jgi:hypothetical protein
MIRKRAEKRKQARKTYDSGSEAIIPVPPLK